jgi:dTDP-4-dehydrorhamnose reductase
MRILITGSNGLLGQKLVDHCIRSNQDFLATSKGENRNSNCPKGNYAQLDIQDEDAVKELFVKYNPTHVIHTAAITNVDYCELNPEECWSVNADAVNILFKASIKNNAHFQLLSTDFVFDGEKGNYREDDPVGPLSAYARSKVEAEGFLINSSYQDWSIVRTIIVYGAAENLSRGNLIYWAKDALSKGEVMRVVDDQFRAPTWADDLAWACLRICTLNEKGIYHISGPETMSIFNIVMRIARHFNLSTDNIVKVSSAELKQPALRPPKTGFDLEKAKAVLGYKPKTLEQTLDLL